MKTQFLQHLQINLPQLLDKKLLVACSGGLDSTTLCRLLNSININFAIAHCNFSLRGKESDLDEEFAENLSKNLSVPFFSQKFDTEKYAIDSKISIQMAARELRYKWFEEVLETQNFDFLLTAHHADDSLETFLINLSRGTGLKGLTGIPEINGQIIRPLLPFSREEILRYASKNKIKWREDESNSQTKYLRNQIRHKIVPELKELDENFLQNFNKTQSNLQQSGNLVEDYLQLIFNSVVTENFDGYTISISKLKEFPNINSILFELLSPFGFTDFTALLELLTAQSGKQIFSNSHRLLKNRDTLLLSIASEENKLEFFEIQENTSEVSIPIELKFEEVESVKNSSQNAIFVDADKLQFPLTLRKWKDGDTFQPFGMKGNKKLGKYFKDEKLSLVAKQKIWLLCSGEKIIWIVGLRAENYFRIEENTKKTLQITLKSPFYYE